MEKNITYDELLYSNLKILAIRYKMSSELECLLSKDMFAVPNTKGFCLVILYILSCLNKEKFAKNLTWPIHDKASHSQFHNQVWEVSRRIKEDYPRADLPKVQKSFFLHPTGKQFVQYLVKLSSLVMLENSKFGKSFSARKPKYINSIERWLTVLRFNLKENNDEFEAYRNETKLEMRNLHINIEKNTSMVNNYNNTLRKIVDNSKFDAATKECLGKYDENTMKAIKQDIEEQKGRVCKFIERVENMKSNLNELNDVILSPRNSVCGKHLVSCLPFSIVQDININEETGITLEDLMKVLCENIRYDKQKLLVEDLSNNFPKLLNLKDNLEKLLEQFEKLYCEIKSFSDHVQNPSNSNTEQNIEKCLTLKETNLEYLNISTPRNLHSPSTSLSKEDIGATIDWFNKESSNNRPLKQGLFSPPSVDTSYISENVNEQHNVAHKVKALYLMSTCKKRNEQKIVENTSPVEVKKNKLVRRVLAMNSPEVNKVNTVDPKIVENTPNLTAVKNNDTDQNIEETVKKVLQNAHSFTNNSESSLLTSCELESINEINVSDTTSCDWNSDSLQRITTLMLSPEPFVLVNGSSTPVRNKEPCSPVEAILSKERKVSKVSRPSLEALKLRFLKVKESAFSIPKLED